MASSIRKYHKNECITFKSTKGKFGGLSNMSPGYPLLINNSLIRNSEILYQCLKYPKQSSIQKAILSKNSPITAKKTSRKYQHLERYDWNSVRFKIMRFSLEIKLYQNFEKFSDLLRSTDKLAIVEYSEEDKIWGACQQGDYYIGTNALGRLLMELRQNLYEGTFKVSIPNIEDLIFLDEEIRIIEKETMPNNR